MLFTISSLSFTESEYSSINAILGKQVHMLLINDSANRIVSVIMEFTKVAYSEIKPNNDKYEQCYENKELTDFGPYKTHKAKQNTNEWPISLSNLKLSKQITSFFTSTSIHNNTKTRLRLYEQSIYTSGNPCQRHYRLLTKHLCI